MFGIIAALMGLYLLWIFFIRYASDFLASCLFNWLPNAAFDEDIAFLKRFIHYTLQLARKGIKELTVRNVLFCTA